MSKADEIKEEACSINYESEYKRLKEENLYIRQENEKKLQANQQMWQQIVDEKENKKTHYDRYALRTCLYYDRHRTHPYRTLFKVRPERRRHHVRRPALRPAHFFCHGVCRIIHRDAHHQR